MRNSKYKLSMYNLVIRNQNQNILWNTSSNAVIELQNDDINYIHSFNGKIDNSDNFRIFKANGCIVNENYNEYGKIVSDMKRSIIRVQSSHVNFVIAPGLACNYKCTYCFQENYSKTESMSEDTLEAVYDFMVKEINLNKSLRKFSITWFGGEPLLYLDIIQSLSLKIIPYLIERNINYSAKLVTNGRYLNSENVDLLKACKIEKVQVTVDGMHETYTNNKQADPGDFEAVVSNIVHSANKFNVTVRINTDKARMDDAYALTEYLLRDKELDGKIRVYLAMIRDYGNDINREIERNGEFIQCRDEFVDYFFKNFSSQSLGVSSLNRKTVFCSQICSSNYCIGPSGELYKCENHFGNEAKIVGDVYTGAYYNQTQESYMNYEFCDQCKSCIVFPLCLGGCIDDQIEGRQTIDCESFIKSAINFKMLELQKFLHKD